MKIFYRLLIGIGFILFIGLLINCSDSSEDALRGLEEDLTLQTKVSAMDTILNLPNEVCSECGMDIELCHCQLCPECRNTPSSCICFRCRDCHLLPTQCTCSGKCPWCKLDNEDCVCSVCHLCLRDKGSCICHSVSITFCPQCGKPMHEGECSLPGTIPSPVCTCGLSDCLGGSACPTQGRKVCTYGTKGCPGGDPCPCAAWMTTL